MSVEKSIESEIKTLTRNFNKQSGNYLKDLDFKFGNKVIIKDKTPLISSLKTKEDILQTIIKNIKQGNYNTWCSNTYYKRSIWKN